MPVPINVDGRDVMCGESVTCLFTDAIGVCFSHYVRGMIDVKLEISHNISLLVLREAS